MPSLAEVLAMTRQGQAAPPASSGRYEWAPDFSTFIDRSKYPNAEWRASSGEDGLSQQGLSGAFYRGDGEQLQGAKYQDLKKAGLWDLSRPDSPTWKYLQNAAGNNGDIRTNPGALLVALQSSGAAGAPTGETGERTVLGMSGGGRNRGAYEQNLREALTGLPPEFVNEFVPAAGARQQQHWDSLPDDSMSIGSMLSDVGHGVADFTRELAPFALAALGTYFGVQGLGGAFGGAEAAGAGASAGGTAGASGLESFLGPATGSVEAAPIIGSAGAPTVSGIAEGAGAFLPVAGLPGGGMPAAIPETDPTFGGALTQTGAGQYEALPFTPPGSSAPLGGVPAPLSNADRVARVLRGDGSLEDVLNLGGAALPGVVGAVAANNQANSLEALTREYMAMGAPSRGRFESSFSPGFSMANEPGYKDALDQTMKAFLHKASISGNPADSPNAWMQTLQDVNSTLALPALQNYRSMNANAGGLSQFASAAPTVATGAINANANVANALGGAAADIFNPPRSLADLLRGVRV